MVQINDIGRKFEKNLRQRFLESATRSDLQLLCSGYLGAAE